MKTTIKAIVVLIIILFTFGCQKDAQAKMEAENIELVKTAWSEWSNHNIDFFYDFYDQEEYKYYVPFNNSEPDSFDELVTAMETAWKNFPDVSINIEKIFASDDMVVTMMLIKGTHTEIIENRPPPNGNKIETGVINIVRFEDGKVVEEWENVDRLGYLKQLGYEFKELD